MYQKVVYEYRLNGGCYLSVTQTSCAYAFNFKMSAVVSMYKQFIN